MTEATIKVYETDGTVDGGSGHPMKAGWWWEVQIGAHRSRAWAPDSNTAWDMATTDLLERRRKRVASVASGTQSDESETR